MSDNPFRFDWYVDQAGYIVESVIRPRGEIEIVSPRGGPRRYYSPLDDDGLWLRFAETCRDRAGVLQFAATFGLLREGDNPLGLLLAVAQRFWALAEHLRAGDHYAAVVLFNDRASDAFALPLLYEAILPSTNKPGVFEAVLLPRVLEDALKHQAALAITGKRQFRRCRNCPNWFRLGSRSAAEGGRSFTARREFCSDRCRVAWARRQRREATAHA